MRKLSFLFVKDIPTLFWSSDRELNLRPRIVTLVFLITGLVLFGLGEAILVAAGIGVSPWTVLALGVSNVSELSIGESTFVISVGVLVFWIPLRQCPGIGTVLNAILVAASIEVALPYLPTPNGGYWQITQVLVGVLVTSLGSGVYLISNLGPGPRDGLMTGLQRRTNLPIAWVRNFIELTAVIAGWLLGGPVGIGTVLYAILIGPFVSGSLFTLNIVFKKILKAHSIFMIHDKPNRRKYY